MVDKNRAYLLGRHVSALENRFGHFDRIERHTAALENRFGHFDRIGRHTAAWEQHLGHFDRIGRHTAAWEQHLGHFDRIGRHTAAWEQHLGHFDRIGRHTAAWEQHLGHFDRIGRHTAADMESLMKFEHDWQKRVNFLSETQASLGFPNIIRGELAVDSFRISTPTQRRTPLFDLPPTSSTGEVYEEISPKIIPAPSPELVPITNHKPVFIVHGHDHETRDDVSNFVSNWGLTATILDKQANKGRTIIEKFEDCADEASFAIVLLTPDDVGASVKDKTHLKYRARQNVIFEWGYFSGSIGRERVCILYKGNLELPSDTQGVVYVRMDDNGEWKQSIVREMESVGLLIDANKI